MAQLEFKQINFIIFAIFTYIILFSMFFLEPVRYGDGNEYYLMLESLSNHLSPELQERDINDFYTGEFNAFGEKIKPYRGYFKSTNNKWYSYHFWAYSLFSVPTKLVLELFKLDARKSLQITNAFLFILLLAVITFFPSFKEKQKMFFMLLLIFSPALWFIRWSHPEIFIFVFATLGLIFMHKNQYKVAIVFAAIASWQNQALIIFVLFLLIKGWLSSKKIKELLKLSAISSIAFIPNLFYFLNFGKLTLLPVSISHITLRKIFEVFFDLNLGLLPYIPLSLFLFLGICIWKTYKAKKFVLEAQLFLVLFLMITAVSSQGNWNAGRSGPIRYSIWMIPFISYIIIKNLNAIFNRKIAASILIAGIILQSLIIIQNGFLVKKLDHVYHTAAARTILNNAPSLYNPTHDIFCRRTMQRIKKCENPTVYFHNNQCKKALVTCGKLDLLKDLCGYIPEKIRLKCENHSNKWIYVNY